MCLMVLEQARRDDQALLDRGSSPSSSSSSSRGLLMVMAGWQHKRHTGQPHAIHLMNPSVHPFNAGFLPNVQNVMLPGTGTDPSPQQEGPCPLKGS